MRLAVCILHYGQKNTTARLHTQLLEADPKHANDIFVLDNASPEPYPEAWARLGDNIFWGGAFAWALDAFAAKGYTHLWFCNNDVLFVSDPPYVTRAAVRVHWLEKQGRVGVYSPCVTSNPYHKHMAQARGAACCRAPYVDGIAPLVSLACVAAVGGLELGENPYGYGVDVWLSHRAARAGWGVWVDHALVLRHKYHTAARDAAGFMARAARAEEAYMTERFGPRWREALEAMQTMREGTQ